MVRLSEPKSMQKTHPVNAIIILLHENNYQLKLQSSQERNLALDEYSSLSEPCISEDIINAKRVCRKASDAFHQKVELQLLIMKKSHT